ncbi:neuroendocrine protein 7B2-like [Apostichopus japonicus]|uniref:neuroendocrine protein 7B2-like n=1 Tax=Stichopus japonicus TaxID=307972 RepID=UPI003AB3A55B
MEVLGVQLVLASALMCLAHGYMAYNDEIPPIERLAIRSYILRNLYDTTGVENEPATRKDEAAPETKPAIPPNTFVSGGTGEGKQHLGSDGKIPNKQVAIPEIQSGYDTPPNPCPVNAKVKDLEQVVSQRHPDSRCACINGWDEDKEDCTEASKCCLMNMPNLAEFVAKYQNEARVDGFADPFASNQYIGGGNKRAEHVAKKSPMLSKRSIRLHSDRIDRHFNPYLAGQRLSSNVAKKAPAYANRLPVM